MILSTSCRRFDSQSATRNVILLSSKFHEQSASTLAFDSKESFYFTDTNVNNLERNFQYLKVHFIRLFMNVLLRNRKPVIDNVSQNDEYFGTHKVSTHLKPV